MIKYIKTLLLSSLLFFTACEGLVEGINDNPNDILISDIDARLFLTGAMLANAQAQVGHLNRIAGMYSGQLVGYTSLYSNIYGFSLSTVESNGVWSRVYVGTIPNVRHIRSQVPEDNLLVGITKVIEANAIGSAALIFGDVPYTEVNNPEIEDPKFDDQISVINAAIDLLDEAISDLAGASSRTLSEDIYFEGDANKWTEAAYTLKARYLLNLRDYAGAYSAALNGISSEAGSMKYIPRGSPDIAEGDKNMFWTIISGSRTGDIGNKGSFLLNLVDPTNPDSRNNAKTDETARHGYYTIEDQSAASNEGIIQQFEPQNMVTYAENQLILAETAARTTDFGTALGHLNDLRAWLNTGSGVNANFQDQPYLYEAYTADDFTDGGIENTDGIDPTDALLREIFEERYVSGFGMYLPFNDTRRLRVSDPNLDVPFTMNNGPTPPYAERLPYSFDEINSNENAPEDPGIFAKTPVNQ
ncbi:MAG TPA: SusD/RagB family nutrient-binding outer membrane lipoprotein [Saprospiraceae bacterium]|nr:SusD/RagB family nutrient-binding outer membrane lipoprotein [Saprospiraceae bacterium]